MNIYESRVVKLHVAAAGILFIYSWLSGCTRRVCVLAYIHYIIYITVQKFGGHRLISAFNSIITPFKKFYWNAVRTLLLQENQSGWASEHDFRESI